jgi:hypothetical protein
MKSLVITQQTVVLIDPWILLLGMIKILVDKS